jgi:peptide/nickel transport system permease protein
MTPQHWIGAAVVFLGSAACAAMLRRTRNAAWQRFTTQPLAVVALGVLLFLVIIAIVAPVIAPYRPERQLDIVGLANHGPSWQHPLGTDALSRDTWSRLLYGARVSLGVGALGMLVAVTIGGAVGTVAGYFGRAIDGVLMRVVDAGLAVPRIFLVLAATALWDRLGIGPLVILLGFSGWFGTSRLVRAEVLLLRRSPFVDASHALGAGPWRTLVRDVLPNAAAPLIVAAALGVGNVMLLEAALSFLGVGVQAPSASWGNMIADGRDQLATAPWETLFPGLAIALAVMALNVVGDGLHRALDPQG